MAVAEFAARVRNGETVIGYWVVTDNPVGTERLARVDTTMSPWTPSTA
jgi:4-hydroxy-2-oxoheptanedioate aldolase